MYYSALHGEEMNCDKHPGYKAYVESYFIAGDVMVGWKAVCYWCWVESLPKPLRYKVPTR